MFTTKTLPNPNHRGQMHVAKFIQIDVCECGSEDVARRYTHDGSGEVDGIALTCRACGAHDRGW